jgi:hypothetical protein
VKTGQAVATAALLVAACAAGGPLAEEEAVTELAFETVLHERSSGLDEGLRETIRDERSWGELWARIHRRAIPAPPLAPVDFSRHMLVVVAAGTRRSSGFEIAVRKVTLEEGRIAVEVVETCPPPGSITAMALTQPVEVVRLEKLPQTPVFRESRGPSCP